MPVSMPAPQRQPKTAVMTVAEVLALLRRYGPLLTGITVSGGEATTSCRS